MSTRTVTVATLVENQRVMAESIQALMGLLKPATIPTSDHPVIGTHTVLNRITGELDTENIIQDSATIPTTLMGEPVKVSRRNGRIATPQDNSKHTVTYTPRPTKDNPSPKPTSCNVAMSEENREDAMATLANSTIRLVATIGENDPASGEFVPRRNVATFNGLRFGKMKEGHGNVGIYKSENKGGMVVAADGKTYFATVTVNVTLTERLA